MLWLRQLPVYDDIKDLAEGFNQDELDEDDEELDDEEENDDDENNDDEDDSNLGYLN